MEANLTFLKIQVDSLKCFLFFKFSHGKKPFYCNVYNRYSFLVGGIFSGPVVEKAHRRHGLIICEECF